MLVLARQVSEKIQLVEIQTSVEVLAIRKGLVRLGIQAPAWISVLRAELGEPAGPRLFPARPPNDPEAEARLLEFQGAVRDGLGSIRTGLVRLRRQLRSGRGGDLQTALTLLEADLQAFLRHIECEGDAYSLSLPEVSRKLPADNTHCRLARDGTTAQGVP